MSLDVSLIENRPFEIYESNITHNLADMAKAAGIYEHLWRPEEKKLQYASELIRPLQAGLDRLKANPDQFREYNASNGWGKYEDLVRFVQSYLGACLKNPNALIQVSR